MTPDAIKLMEVFGLSEKAVKMMVSGIADSMSKLTNTIIMCKSGIEMMDQFSPRIQQDKIQVPEHVQKAYGNLKNEIIPLYKSMIEGMDLLRRFTDMNEVSLAKHEEYISELKAELAVYELKENTL